MRAMVRGLLVAVGVLGFANGAMAQVPSAQEQALINAVSEQLKAQDVITFSRVTREGELASCEVVFETYYLDRRANQGRPVVVMGSIASMYSKGKYPSVTLKVKTNILDVQGANPWRPVQPTFADAVIGKLALKPFRVADFVCEGGGLCQMFVDKQMGHYKAILDAPRLDIDLRVSLVKGGMDQSLKLGSIGDPKAARAALDGYQACTYEVLNKTIADMQKM